jgi:hypothetical protein
MWPVLVQHGLAIRFDLAHADDLEAGALEAKLEAADSAEQAEHPHSRTRALCVGLVL